LIQVYKPGSSTLDAVVEAFGADILAEVNELSTLILYRHMSFDSLIRLISIV
jgi:dephospho-CoA kinase